MLGHVTLRVPDLDASQRFYATPLQAAGRGPPEAGDGFAEREDLGVTQATAHRPATRSLRVAFAVASLEVVDAFWQTGTAAGFPDHGAPGERPEYSPSSSCAFLLAPDGTSVVVVHHHRER